MSNPKKSSFTGARLVAGLLLAGALVARFAYIWGPPHGWDERYVVLHALRFGTGDLNPRHFDWPASPFYYLTFAFYGIQFVAGYLLGVYPDGQTFAVGALVRPEEYYIVPRLLSAVFGVATAWALWRGLRAWLGTVPAALAAFFVLITPGHIALSRFGTSDVAMLFFLTLAMLLSLEVVRDRRAERRDFVKGGLWIGLATAMKYPGVLSSLSLAGAHASTRPASRFRWLLLAAACSVATFFVVTPFALLDYRTFIGDLGFMTGHHFGSPAGGTTLTARFHRIQSLTGEAVGLPLLMVALVGLGTALARWRTYAPVWSTVAPVALSLVLGLAVTRQRFFHYAVPLVPELAVFVAVGWHAVVNDTSLRRLRVPFGAGLAVAATLALWPAIHKAWMSSHPTTESAAVAWALAHTSESDAIATDELLMILPTDAAIRREIDEARVLGHTGRVDYWQSMARLLSGVTTFPRRDTQVVYVVDPVEGYLDRLIQARVKFYICNEAIAARGARRSEDKPADERSRYYADLRSRGRLEARFDSRDGILQGVPFAVYRLPSTVGEEPTH